MHKRRMGDDFTRQFLLTETKGKSGRGVSLLTSSDVFPIVPALEKSKFVRFLIAQEVPAVVRMPSNQILLPDIMREDQIGCFVVPRHIDGPPVAVC